MAGNTKLMGFSPDGLLVFQRWGMKSAITVSKESLEAIRHACIHVLPAECPQKEWTLGDITVNYREDYGRIVIEMSPDAADELAELLHSLKPDGVLEGDLFRLPEAIDEQRQVHEDYIDEKEPWVE